MATGTSAIRIGVFSIRSERGGVILERHQDGSIDRLEGVLTLQVTVPDGTPETIPIETIKSGSGGAIEASGKWNSLEVSLRLRYSYDIDGVLGSVEVRNTGEDGQFRFSILLQILGDADPDWLIPGLFYNENRPRECEVLFPGYSEIQRDAGRFLSNHWTFRSDRAALPAVFCQTFRSAAYISTDEFVNRSRGKETGVGPTALGLRTVEGMPELSIHAPFREEPVKFSYCTPDGIAPEDSFFTMERGETFSMPFCTGMAYASEGIREQQYRALYEHRWVHHPLKPKLSTMETERIAVDGIVRWHLDNDHVMIHETPPPERRDRRLPPNVEAIMHAGWQSGVFPAYVLLWHGRDITNPEYVRGAIDVMDRICAETAPCGTIYPVFTSAGDAEGIAVGDELSVGHSRTIAEAVLFLMRALRLELSANTPHPLWYSAAVSSLNSILETQREDGAFPNTWDLQTGMGIDYEGSAGLAWVAALCSASHLFRSKAYLKAARRAAMYYASMLEEGFLYGSIEDQPGVPSSDDYQWAMLSYLLLYEADHDPRWLDLSRRAAELALTWRFAYNVHFPGASTLGQSGFQSRGGDICSASMPVTGAFGLFTYGEMRRLSAYLGDAYFERRALEGRTFATQLLARTDGEFNALSGMAISNILHTDWTQPKSMILEVGHVMTNAMIEYAELIERHLNIPVEAMQGDEKSVEEAASRTSIVPLERGLVLPESAASRRTQELLRRRAKESELEGTSQVDVAFVGHGKQRKQRQKPQHTPRPITSPDADSIRHKTPMGARHTPLPQEYDPRSDKRTFDLGSAAEAAGGKRDNLLANLFSDDEEVVKPTQTPPPTKRQRIRTPPPSSVNDEDTDRGKPGRKRWNTEALEAMLDEAEETRRQSSDVVRRDVDSNEESGGDDVEIRWKIF